MHTAVSLYYVEILKNTFFCDYQNPQKAAWAVDMVSGDLGSKLSSGP